MYLGIDLGTSEVKVLLLDGDGKVVGTANSPLTVSRPQPRYSEQNPEDWWVATCEALDRLRDAFPTQYARIKGLGLTGQMHGATLLDANDQVLRPAILWNDMRSVAECAELVRREPETLTITGNLAMPGFTAPKLLWVAKHEPDIFARMRHVLLPKDYLRLKLTGEYITDPSDAAGTLWLDVGKRQWSERMLAACDMRLEQMPRLVEGSAPAGRLLPTIADRLGLQVGIAIAGGGGDNAGSAIGIGASQAGDGFISLGTSGVLFVVNDRFQPNPASAVHAFCHALPGRWHQMSVVLSAASCLRWACNLTGIAEAGLLAEIEPLSFAQRRSAPIFLPYLSGERTPHNDPYAQGILFGITHATDRAQMGYAVLEGVAFSLADGLAALADAGTLVSALSLLGGGSRSPYWAQLIADVLELDIHVHDGAESGAALGAAALGWLAAGGTEDAVLKRPSVHASYHPDATYSALLAMRLARYRALYRANAPLFIEAANAGPGISAGDTAA
jgi:xylulokinase